jgi:hypothetical protein
MNISTTNWSFHSAATSTGNGEVFYPNKNDTLTIEITGTATSSTIIFEGQGGSDTWYAIQGVKLSDFSMASQTTGKGELWQFDLSGIKAFRARISAISGGNISVTGRAVISNG